MRYCPYCNTFKDSKDFPKRGKKCKKCQYEKQREAIRRREEYVEYQADWSFLSKPWRTT